MKIQTLFKRILFQQHTPFLLVSNNVDGFVSEYLEVDGLYSLRYIYLPVALELHNGRVKIVHWVYFFQVWLQTFLLE